MSLEMLAFLTASLVIGYAAARVVGRVARIGFYILLGMSIMYLIWFVIQLS